MHALGLVLLASKSNHEQGPSTIHCREHQGRAWRLGKGIVQTTKPALWRAEVESLAPKNNGEPKQHRQYTWKLITRSLKPMTVTPDNGRNGGHLGTKPRENRRRNKSTYPRPPILQIPNRPALPNQHDGPYTVGRSPR
jgi:hypothetical protein